MQTVLSSGLPAVNIACVSGEEPPGVWEALAAALEGFFFGDGFRLQGTGCSNDGSSNAPPPEGPRSVTLDFDSPRRSSSTSTAGEDSRRGSRTQQQQQQQYAGDSGPASPATSPAPGQQPRSGAHLVAAAVPTSPGAHSHQHFINLDRIMQ